MLPLPAGREANPGEGAAHYVRHRPERMLLYQLVEEYYPAFVSAMAAQGTALPGYVQREFEDYLRCGRLEHGFLRVRCDSCHTEHLVAFSCYLELKTIRSRGRRSLDLRALGSVVLQIFSHWTARR
jgi:hypothetical protein